jgi:hypothetical protein
LLQLLQPIALFGLTSLLIPLAIHLWSSRKGKVLPVGSIVFLEKAASRQRKNLQLSQLLLFILRCLLLIVLSLLLSRPVWQTQPGSKEKGWILAEPGRLREIHRQFGPLLDSLQQAGYSLHYFREGFEKASWGDSTEVFPAAADSTAYWQLYTQLDHRLPPGIPVYLFTTRYLYHFSGARPVTTRKLYWQTYVPAQRVQTWLAAATRCTNDSICLLTGNSDSTATWFTPTMISTAAPAPYTVEHRQGKWLVSLHNSQPVEADSGVLHVTLFTDQPAQDAAYLQAALQAIAGFMHCSIPVTYIHQPGDIPAAQDWLFWLSEKPLPQGIRAKNIFRYAAGQPVSGNTCMVTAAGTVPLYRYIATDSMPANTLWRNGFGNSMLTITNPAAQPVYTFYSRFLPAWNGLAWSPQFPQWLLQLLFPAGVQATAPHDLRSINPQQVTPVVTTERNTIVTNAAGINTTDLSPVCWLVLLVLFGAERLVSFQTVKRRKDD